MKYKRGIGLLSLLLLICIIALKIPRARESSLLEGCVGIGMRKSAFINELKKRGYSYWEDSSGKSVFESRNEHPNSSDLKPEPFLIYVNYDWTDTVTRASGCVEELRTPSGKILKYGDSLDQIVLLLGPPTERKSGKYHDPVRVELKYRELDLTLTVGKQGLEWTELGS